MPPAGKVTRTPFAGNKVPQSRFDPLSSSLLKDFWDGNTPGDNITRVNNFKVGYTEVYNYYNFSDRVDYNVTDKWKVYGRIGRYFTDDLAPNATPNNSRLFVPTGTSRGATQISGDAIWTVNPSTVVNFHGDWHKVIDAYVSTSLGENGWGSIWGSSSWYKSYQDASPGVPVYFPLFSIGGTSFGGRGFYWDQKPEGMAYNAKISKQKGSHFLKAGIEHRRGYGVTFVGNTSQFFFPQALTAETYISPDTKHNGFGFASFLLGALDGSSQMIGGPAPDPHSQFWGMFFQDDWKLNRRVTINMGIRNEYESAWYDPMRNMSQGLDLTAPVPEMQASQPKMPAQAISLMGSSTYKWNGQWQWTSDSHPGMWNPQKLALAPRIGAAIKIDDRTALRVGYARYLLPYEMILSTAPVSGFETVSFLEPPFFGMKAYQNTAGLLEGVPQQTISNPYPSGVNPLIAPNGKAAGTAVGRGGTALLRYPQDTQKARNDRFNVNFQRQIPGQIVASFTWFFNIGNQSYSYALNNRDPRIDVAQQGAISASVDNPFYNYLTSAVFPGPLRNQKTVSLGSLLSQYPHYGGLYEVGKLGAGERYHSLEFKAQKAFSKGWNFLWAYVYIKEKVQTTGLNELDTYQNTLQYLNSNQPRHRLSMAGTYELPFGIGKTFGKDMPRAADAILGGWKLTGMSTMMSGSILRFGKMNYLGGDVTVSDPSPQKWFNTAAFSNIAANTYVIRSNPIQFDSLTGPGYFMLDGSLTKSFKFFEKVRAELEMRAFNALNRLEPRQPRPGRHQFELRQGALPGHAVGDQFGRADDGVGQRQRPPGRVGD